MFKAWQIFVFTLIPLALVLAGVILGSIHGSDSEPEQFQRPVPTPRGMIEVQRGLELVVVATEAKDEKAAEFVDCLPDDGPRVSVVLESADVAPPGS